MALKWVCQAPGCSYRLAARGRRYRHAAIGTAGHEAGAWPHSHSNKLKDGRLAWRQSVLDSTCKCMILIEVDGHADSTMHIHTCEWAGTRCCPCMWVFLQKLPMFSGLLTLPAGPHILVFQDVTPHTFCGNLQHVTVLKPYFSSVTSVTYLWWHSQVLLET